MEAIHVAATPAELYNAVLVDTPLGKLFINTTLLQNGRLNQNIANTSLPLRATNRGNFLVKN
jgi:hypothetical protein